MRKAENVGVSVPQSRLEKPRLLFFSASPDLFIKCSRHRRSEELIAIGQNDGQLSDFSVTMEKKTVKYGKYSVNATSAHRVYHNSPISGK